MFELSSPSRYLLPVAMVLLACGPPPSPDTAVEVPVPPAGGTLEPAPTGSANKPKIESATPLPDLTLTSSDKEAMKPKLNEWLASLPPLLRLNLEDAELRYNSRAKSHQLRQDDWRIFVHFEGGASGATHADELASRIRYWGIDHAPAPIEADGWDFRMQTPLSSFNKGFEVLSYEDGIATIRLNASFFALRGDRPRSGDCEPLMDAPMPGHCFVQIRSKHPFTLTIKARISD